MNCALLLKSGTTIGLGLLFDTLIVRSFMTPSIAALLGRWFWWPQIVRPRPASSLLEPVGTRASVRVLLRQPRSESERWISGAGGDLSRDDPSPTSPTRSHSASPDTAIASKSSCLIDLPLLTGDAHDGRT